jgi:hypothetical protein
LYYANSVEEQRYLSAVRKEKDAFTRLIREKGNMALVIQSDTAVEDPQEFFLRTVNTRIAGGGRVAATAEPPRVLSPPQTSLFRLLSIRESLDRRCQVYCTDEIWKWFLPC